ncbi:MAG: hypothetical protein HQL32_17925 [Planctomycetes bacterium]|nr:hypothetical protein [Planctomycetota bacterium]
MSRLSKVILILTALMSFSTFVPYMMAPLYVLKKNWTLDEYYSFKFSHYDEVNALNDLPPGKILFVGSPVYWLKRDHVFSVYSETYVDYTRLESAQALKDRLREIGIKYIALEKHVIEGMSKNERAYYRGKAYCAKRCIGLYDELLAHNDVTLKSQGEYIWLAELGAE